jgi:hypothetical protein
MPGNSWVSKLSLVDLEPAPVPEVLSSPHRLTLQLQKSFSLRRPDSYGRVGSSSDDIDVKVAPASIPRALLFLDAFVKAAEQRGFAFVLPGSEYEPGLSIVIKRQKVKFSVFEESNRVTSTRSKGSLRSPSAQALIEFRPSGRFSFKIREYLSARQEPTFSDRPGQLLEGQLSVILHGLSTAALELREKAERQAKERETEEKLADQHRLAEVLFRKLGEDLEDWTKAEALHRLIAHVERKMESETAADPSYAHRWLHWARRVATSLDPASRSLDEFLQNYRTLARPRSPNDLDEL